VILKQAFGVTACCGGICTATIAGRLSLNQLDFADNADSRFCLGQRLNHRMESGGSCAPQFVQCITASEFFSEVGNVKGVPQFVQNLQSSGFSSPQVAHLIIAILLVYSCCRTQSRSLLQAAFRNSRDINFHPQIPAANIAALSRM
jgi:hypothetical protein